MTYDFETDRKLWIRGMIAAVIVIILLSLYFVSPARACCECECNQKVVVNVNNILTQVAYITQQQSQMQQQSQQINSAPLSGWGNYLMSNIKTGPDIEQESQTYSRLLYPGEVIVAPVPVNGSCWLLAGLPVGFYSIGGGHGYFEDQVQSIESIPAYDPIYHRMEFGMTPVVDKIDYWTMKARIDVSPGAEFCVVDNRAGFNDFTTIELRVQSRQDTD